MQHGILKRLIQIIQIPYVDYPNPDNADPICGLSTTVFNTNPDNTDPICGLSTTVFNTNPDNPDPLWGLVSVLCHSV
jgi:hypothetical protein